MTRSLKNFRRCVKQMLHIISFDEICTIVSWAIQLSMMAAFDIRTPASIYLTSKAKVKVEVLNFFIRTHNSSEFHSAYCIVFTDEICYKKLNFYNNVYHTCKMGLCQQRLIPIVLLLLILIIILSKLSYHCLRLCSFFQNLQTSGKVNSENCTL
ncbi:hypothetical protein T05_6467 [Trichinella murrelli]|uniref:Uncharacterized protein n=1 Tax=Trichinella murrelli TaxID=144512 RepID=A0A0V0TSL3_9BILA|nr:hypothetical protein T05_6467 [Trichinella murrelli]